MWLTLPQHCHQRESGQDLTHDGNLEAGADAKSHGGVLLTGLLLMVCSGSIGPRTTSLGVGAHSEPGPPQEMPIASS